MQKTPVKIVALTGTSRPVCTLLKVLEKGRPWSRAKAHISLPVVSDAGAEVDE